MNDPHAPLKDNAWRELAEIDAKLGRGEIDEAAWHEAAEAIVVPAYLAVETPWGQSYGLEISAALAALARKRLASWAERIFVGNALIWDPPREFTYVRTGLDYVPADRRRDLVTRLLESCERLIVGVFNEHESERTTEDLLESWGLSVAGRSVRANRWNPGMEYRVLWIDR